MTDPHPKGQAPGHAGQPAGPQAGPETRHQTGQQTGQQTGGQTGHQPSHQPGPRVDFVDAKAPDPSRLMAALAPAIAQNRHSNFGPVSRQLETLLAAQNGQPPSTVMTANATLGLQAAVAALDNHRGRPHRWAVSDFGFFTSFIGPFQDQTYVPCAPDGGISIPALSQVPRDSYDGILATNVFGLGEGFDALFDFARRHGKTLLIDNAAGFGALAPSHAAGLDLLWAEVVSFHHTKPWGMGEGGAVFASAGLQSLLRAAVNFGVGEGRRLQDPRWVTNAKLSELAAAQILLRVQDAPQWVPGFRAQAARLMRLGQEAGLTPVIAQLPQRAVPSQIALRADHPIALEDLANPDLRILKYYRPGAGSGPGARALFDHILNLPCHGGVAALADDDIRALLCQIQDRAQNRAQNRALGDGSGRSSGRKSGPGSGA